MRKGYFINKQYIYVVILVISCIFVYFPILRNNFLYNWDDQLMIINHYTSGGWSLSNIWNMFTDFYAGQYAPFLEFSTLILYSIDQYNPFIFHLASLLWHIGNVILVWLFINRLLQTRKESITPSIPLLAFCTAFLFAVHPSNTEAVAWLSAMKILIYAFFFLLGMISYLSYIETRKISFFIKTIICFLFSFWGKEQAVSFPFALILLDWFTKRDLKDKVIRIEKIVFFSMASLFGIITILSQGTGEDPNTYSFFNRMAFAGYAIFEYIAKAVFPVNLNFLYPYPMLPGENLPVRFLLYPLLILILAYWIFINRKKTLLVFWTLFFGINLLFSIHIIPMNRNTIVADRYIYLSIIAIMFAVAYLLLKLKTVLSERKKWYYYGVLLLFAGYCIYLGTYTYTYSKQWKDSDTIREYTRKVLNKRDLQTQYKTCINSMNHF